MHSLKKHISSRHDHDHDHDHGRAPRHRAHDHNHVAPDEYPPRWVHSGPGHRATWRTAEKRAGGIAVPLIIGSSLSLSAHLQPPHGTFRYHTLQPPRVTPHPRRPKQGQAPEQKSRVAMAMVNDKQQFDRLKLINLHQNKRKIFKKNK